jgi:hypothetical protein
VSLPAFCYECGEEFRYDDCGGYNPPCSCGCQRCPECCRADREYDNDPDPRDDLEPEPPRDDVCFDTGRNRATD